MEIPSADASFLYAKEVSVTGTSGSAISDGEGFSMLEKVCTIDMLRLDTTTFLSCNQEWSLIQRFQRNVAIFLSVTTLFALAFYCENVAVFASPKMRSSHVTIVRYIQQKDGKK